MRGFSIEICEVIAHKSPAPLGRVGSASKIFLISRGLESEVVQMHDHLLTWKLCI
jgi:hypothetical protein